MKTIIAGSRSIERYAEVERAVEASGFEITEVVCGMARGVDLLGKAFGDRHGIPVKPMPAQWRPKGPGGLIDHGAGYARNTEMAAYADALIALWDGKSHGTAHMISMAVARRLKVYVHLLEEKPQ